MTEIASPDVSGCSSDCQQKQAAQHVREEISKQYSEAPWLVVLLPMTT